MRSELESLTEEIKAKKKRITEKDRAMSKDMKKLEELKSLLFPAETDGAKKD